MPSSAIYNGNYYELLFKDHPRAAVVAGGTGPAWWSWPTSNKSQYFTDLENIASELGGSVANITSNAEESYLKNTFESSVPEYSGAYAYISGAKARLNYRLPHPDGTYTIWGNADNTFGAAPEYALAKVPLSYFSISDIKIIEGNNGNVTITRTGGSSTPQTIRVTSTDGTAKRSDNDYSLVDTTLTFLAGETSKTVTISTTNDLNVEGSESFKVTIAPEGSDDVPPQIAKSSGNVEILDNEFEYSGNLYSTD